MYISDQEFIESGEAQEAVYRDEMHRPPHDGQGDHPPPTFMDVLGRNRWPTDYYTLRLNGMSHPAAIEEVKRRIRKEAGIIVPPQPIPPNPSGPFQGYLRLWPGATHPRPTQVFGDDAGPRLMHGCSWFPGVVIAHQDPDEAKRQLDRIAAAHQLFVRILWRLNGNPWAAANLSCDPIRDSWWEGALRNLLTWGWDRGIRFVLASGDYANWTQQQAEESYRRVGQIAASVNQQVVCLMGGLNEIHAIYDESPEGIARVAAAQAAGRQAYPWGQCAISDPGDRAQAGMEALCIAPATMALIHNIRQTVADAVRRAFNARHENYPGKPINEDEPTGPDSDENGPWDKKVYQAVNDPAWLFAIYTMHILVGSMSTYFNDPALYNRRPLDSTWGFKELPPLWKLMGIPGDVGRWRTVHGLDASSPMDVGGSHAARADSVVAPDSRTGFGIISGSHDGVYPWTVRSRWDASVTRTWYDGRQSLRRYAAGEVLDVAGPDPGVLRFDRL